MPVQVDRIGPYELRGELGRGAMARVWRAWDANLEREVAIKEPLNNPQLTDAMMEELGKRFVAEGRAAARLSQHPNIVTVYAADVWDGRPAIVMELIDGATLSTLLVQGALTPQETISILDQLLDAVGYAHDCGIVHRDIKPDNVFVTTSGLVKLADFGIAHLDYSATMRATVVGAVLGTPGYMSPEQSVGGSVDGRSDLFSVGVLAYEMLTGWNPFGAGTGADTTSVIYRSVKEPVPELPSSVSAGLQADIRPAIMSALEKDPERRPQTAMDFKTMLHGGAVVPKTTVIGGGRIGQRDVSSWLPYVVVGSILVFALVFITLSATSGAGGGGGSAPIPSSGGEIIEDEVTDEESANANSDEKGQSADESEASSTKKNSKSSTKGESTSNGSGDSESNSSESKSSNGKGTAKVEVSSNGLENAAYPPHFDMLSSSSSLPSTQNNTYSPFNLVDGAWDTVWSEGVSGSGIGEFVYFSATEPQLLSGFNIVAGDPKEYDIYYRNNRPSRMLVELSDGWECEITLEDAYFGSQKVTFDSPHATTSMKLTILDVYASNRDDDTVIAEVEPF